MLKNILMVILMASSLFGTVINFDNLQHGDVVTNQYPDVVFSSTGFVFTGAYAGSAFNTTPPNLICPAMSPFADCTADMTIQFTNIINNISFSVSAINTLDTSMDVLINNTELFTLSFNEGKFADYSFKENANPFNTYPSFTVRILKNIETIKFFNHTDIGGVVFDDFQFSNGGGIPGTVPETSTLVLSGIGLLTLGLWKRSQ